MGASDHTVTHSLYILDPDGNEIELYVDVPGVDWRSNPALVFAPIRPLALSALAAAILSPSRASPIARILDTGALNWSSPNQRIDHRRLVRPLPWVPRLRGAVRAGSTTFRRSKATGSASGVRRRRMTMGGGHVDRRRGGTGPARRRYEKAPRARVRPRAAAADERVLELRGVVHHHLHPVGLSDGIRHRHDQRGPRRHDVGVDPRRVDDAGRRARHGRGVLRLPHRRRPLLLVGEAGQTQRCRLGLVHGMVQPPRPGRRHRRHRLRLLPVLHRLSQPDHGLGGDPGAHVARLRRHPHRARRPEHLRGPGRGLPLRRERVVAHPRGRAHRHRPARRSSPSRVAVVRLHPAGQRNRLPQPLLRLHDRAAVGPVHLHRVRRLGPHDRGDPQRRRWPGQKGSSAPSGCH